MGGSNLMHAHSNYLICISFIRINTVNWTGASSTTYSRSCVPAACTGPPGGQKCDIHLRLYMQSWDCNVTTKPQASLRLQFMLPMPYVMPPYTLLQLSSLAALSNYPKWSKAIEITILPLVFSSLPSPFLPTLPLSPTLIDSYTGTWIYYILQENLFHPIARWATSLSLHYYIQFAYTCEFKLDNISTTSNNSHATLS